MLSKRFGSNAVAGVALALTMMISGCAQPEGGDSPAESGIGPNATASRDGNFPEGFPEDSTPAEPNTHIRFGHWGIISLPDGTQVGVRVNDAWIGTPGLLGERMTTAEPGAPAADLTTAVPFFLSWSYVPLSDTTDSAPEVQVMPGTEGTLYRVTSALADRDCPDYDAPTDREPNLETRHCLVVVSDDGAEPRSLVIKVPGENAFWFFDPPSQYILVEPASPTAEPTE